MSSYQTLAIKLDDDFTYEEYVIERSRFLSCATFVKTEEDVKNTLHKIKKDHPLAAHHTFSYRLLLGKEKAFDDGEPQGTAGVPILEVLRQKELVDTALYVIRYFGGKKLGKGPLIRTYRKAALNALKNAPIITMQEIIPCTVNLTYSDFNRLFSFLKKEEQKNFPLVTIANISYQEQVTILLHTPKENLRDLQNTLGSLLEKYLPLAKGKLSYKKYP